MSRRRSRRPKPTTDQRPPEERLEALVREPGKDRAQRMLIRIREDLDASLNPGPWIAGARTLSERLIISEDSFYYFVELFTECLVFEATANDRELRATGDAMDAVERAHGLRDNEFWKTGEAPDDWASLNVAWERRADEIVGDYLSATGHADVAELWRTNRAEFDRRTADGRIGIWGADEDAE